MPDTLTTNSPIIAAYRAATPGSAAAFEKASLLFPSGVTHDSRYIEPYGLYITRAQDRGNGMSTAIAMSTISAAMARCCSGTAIPRS